MPLSNLGNSESGSPAAGHPNGYAHAEGILNYPIEQVWQTVRGFGNLGQWHPSVKESFLVGDSPAVEVGVVRKVILGDGGVILERLTELDDSAHRLAYTFDETHFPIENYAAVVELRPHDKGTAMSWHSRFECPESAKEELQNTLTAAVYQTGIDALRS